MFRVALLLGQACSDCLSADGRRQLEGRACRGSRTKQAGQVAVDIEKDP